MKHYFRNLPLSVKLVLIGAIPTLFIIYLSSQLYKEKTRNLRTLTQYVNRINVVSRISGLIHEMQNEQKLSFDYALKKEGYQALVKQRLSTDSALRQLRSADDVTLKRFEEYTSLYKISNLRETMDSGKAAPGTIIHFFSSVCFRINTLSGVTFNDKRIIERYYTDVQTQKILAEMLSYLGIIRCNIYNLLITKSYVSETLMGTQGAYEIYRSYEKELLLKAHEATVNDYKNVLKATDLGLANEYIDWLFSTYKLDTVTYNPEQWWTLSEGGVQQLTNLQGNIWQRMNTGLRTDYDRAVASKQRTIVLLIIAIALVITIITYTIASITRSLTYLKFGAEKIAKGKNIEAFKIKSKDAIGSLADSVIKINESNKEIATAADGIGRGDFSVSINPRSNEDILSNALNRMKDDLQYLVKELKESEFRFRQLADPIPQIVWTTDANGTPDYLNKQWYEYAGEAKLSEAVHPEDKGPSEAAFASVMQRRADYTYELRMQNHKTKEYRWFLVRAIPILNDEGKIEKWFGTSTDIHERKKMHEELQELVNKRTEELQRSNDDLQGFAHVASHDMKEPLRKRQVFSSMLSDDSKDVLSEKSQGFLAKIKMSTSRLMNMVEGILNYSTVNSSEQPFETIDLSKVVAAIVSDLEITIQQKKAVVQYTKLPFIKGIPILIHQLLYNLINNALKFIKEDIPPVIAITAKESAEKNKQYLEIVVEDNGIGFDNSLANKIFDVFTRLNPKNKYEGTGLGLALCKKIMTRHDGTIYATSEEGKGSAFYLLFPMHLVVRSEVSENSITAMQ